MRILKILVKSLVMIVVVLGVVSFFLPASSKVDRSVVINAPAEKIYPFVSNFAQFNKWSPWYGIDPEAEYQMSGPSDGVGAKMVWNSDHQQVGSGSQEIIAAVPNQSVTTQLAFEGQGSATATYTLTPATNGTEVTWGFNTDWGYSPIGRYMGLMMDSFVGADYEKGLAALKQLVEAG